MVEGQGTESCGMDVCAKAEADKLHVMICPLWSLMQAFHPLDR